MPIPLYQALNHLTARVLAISLTDEKLRAEVRAFAHAILDATDIPDSPFIPEDLRSSPVEKNHAPPNEQYSIPTPTPPSLPTPTPPALPTPVEPPFAREVLREPVKTATLVEQSTELADYEPLPQLTFAEWSPPDTKTVHQYDDYYGDEFDFAMIERRARLKAEASRFAFEKHEKIALYGDAIYFSDLKPQYDSLILRAKDTPNGYLWMCSQQVPPPRDLNAYKWLGGCYENLARLMPILHALTDSKSPNRNHLEPALNYLAETQSALREALGQFEGQADYDQTACFHWLKKMTMEHHIFIKKYMRFEEKADPKQWEKLTQKIDELSKTVLNDSKTSKQRQKALNNIRYKAKTIQNKPDKAQEEWEQIIKIISDLVKDGLPSSHPELREALMPIMDEMPDIDPVPKEFQWVLRDIDKSLAKAVPTPAAKDSHLSDDVPKVAKLLRGRTVILIGGDKREHAYHALKDAFDLEELNWVDTGGRESVEYFEPYIARPEVALVLLAIRWVRHAFSEVREYCERYDKPLVRLPRGYNPNQVAAAILDQCSDRLE